MGTLVDWQIATYAENGMITPFSKDLINPASYDVTLDKNILIQGDSYYLTWEKLEISEYGYDLQPGEFILGSIQERLKLPSKIEAEFCLKSTVARSGIQHLMAGYADPGYEGNMTLELKNVTDSVVPIHYGMKIGQLRFNALEVAPFRDYSQTGHYQGDSGVMPSRFYEESIL